MNQKKILLIPKSKGLTRQDPDLIPKLFGIILSGFRDLFGIDPGILPGFARDLICRATM
jgi:hypothetical protein